MQISHEMVVRGSHKSNKDFKQKVIKMPIASKIFCVCLMHVYHTYVYKASRFICSGIMQEGLCAVGPSGIW